MPEKGKTSKKKKKKLPKGKPRFPLRGPDLVQKGVRLAHARHIYQGVLEETQKGAPGAKQLVARLEASIAELKEAETVLTDYGLKFYPELKWPRTVAYWRKDLCRTH